MSRSFKKYPMVKCEKSCKFGKKIANKKVRTYLKMGKDLSNGRAYQKVYDRWDICDHHSTEFKEWVISDFHSSKQEVANGVHHWSSYRDVETLEEALNDWKKYYLSK